MKLHKHSNTRSVSTSIDSDLLGDRGEAFYERFVQLQDMYCLELRSKLEIIISDWNQLQQSWQQPTVERLYRHVHNMAGSGATFGFIKLSEIARKLTSILKPVLAGDEPLADTLCRQASGLLVQLCIAAGFHETAPWEALALLVKSCAKGGPPTKRTLFIVDCKSTFVCDIVNQLKRSGYGVEVVPLALTSDLRVL